MPVTLIDTLLVFSGQERSFVGLWDRLLAGFQHQPGFLSANLLQALTGAEVPIQPPFTHVSLISWSSDATCRSALADPAIIKSFEDLRGACLISPGIFAPVRSISM